MKNRNAHPPLTIYEVSKLAGVSTATVSRAMNSATKRKVAPATLQRIARVIERCGYTPHLGARHLGGSVPNTIGILLAHVQGLFFHDYHVQLLAGIADEMLGTEYGFKLIMLKPSPRRWDQYDFQAGEAVSGLIVTHWQKFFSKASVLERLRIPCVVINDPMRGVYSVGGDNLMGGELAARHLYAKGHRRMAVVTGPAWSSDCRLRVQGFGAFFRHHAAHARFSVLQGEYDRERAREAVGTLLKRSPAVTAIFCCNDDMALGALEALRDAGRACPEEVSVVGYDDEPRAQTATPPLTTIRVPLYEMAREGTRRLIQHLAVDGPARPLAGHALLPVTLVERESVRQLL